MNMVNCHVCGTPTNKNGPPYRCAYCGNLVCEAHRLPENHRCTGERLDDDESPKGRGPKPMDLSARDFPGHIPESKHQKTDSSPDVAIDGSIQYAENVDQDVGTEKKSWWRRILPW
ncbi:AN1-type zinc finger domain-containing protein [Haloferax sp. DFSO60]|uniref:AN1-type zinc finger domain-containing protein n=1 Tax=Haloferax sp. DFSO60 TaxID=3388652 RepID=UPI0039787A73